MTGSPDTCSPSFCISGTFSVTELANGIKLTMLKAQTYTYVYRRPDRLEQEDVNHFVAELCLDTRDRQDDREALFAAVPCTVVAFRQLPQFSDLEMETRCDYFRVIFESRIKTAFPAQRDAICKMGGEALRETVDYLDGLIWKLWFDRYTKPLGLKEMTLKGYRAYNKAYPRKKELPLMFYRAFRLYLFLKNLKEMYGHELFGLAGMCNAFQSEMLCSEDQFNDSLRFLLSQALTNENLGNNVAFAKDMQANLETLMTVHLVGMGQSMPEMRKDRVPCLFSKQLTDRQRQFIQHVACNPLTLLQGPPGTGKTEGLVALMAHFAKPLVVTYGGRMVCALQDRFGKREETAHTIHHVCCKAEATWEHGGEKWIEGYDMLVIDEGSNVDAHLFSRLMRLMKNVTRVVIVGDLGQIYPIKSGSPFHDLIRAFPQHGFVLNENKRVDPDSRLLADVSAMINCGELPEDFNVSDALRLHELATRQTFEEVLARYADAIMDVQVVALLNDDCKKLNEWTEHYLLNRGLLSKRGALKLGYHEYYEGKKIMFTKNNNHPEEGYNGYKNGELGQIESIMTNPIRIVLTNGKIVLVKDVGDLAPGYAITCNKSQGSEWKHILFWVNQRNGFFSREHAYVAVSRAKKHCHIMVRALQDLQNLVSRKAPPRHSLLGYLLQKEELSGLQELRPFEDFELKDPARLKLLPKDCAAVPTFQSDETTKKGKRRKGERDDGTTAVFW